MSGYIGTQPGPQATQTRDVFTATSGQTTFATSGYTPNFLDVWLNGVKLVNGDDFTATNGSDVVLTSGATTGDTVEVLSYSTYEVNAQTYTGGLTVNNDAATVLTVDRATSDGTLVDFKKDGTSVGSVGANAGFITIGKGDTGLLFHDGNAAIWPRNLTTLSGRDGAIDLGGNGDRFKSLYLSGGVYLGGTGAANLLDDYEEGTWTPAWGEAVSATYGGGTYGYYTKIGNMVHIYFYLQWSSKTAGNGGYAAITGLPFSVNREPAAYFYYTDGFSKIVDRGRAISTVVQFGERTLYGLSFHNTNHINSSGLIIGNVTYQTNA